MAAAARFDLNMDADKKNLRSRAAADMGTNMTEFVRSAGKEKTAELLDREPRLTLSHRAVVECLLDSRLLPGWRD